ncbi:MAG: hypothetical protein J6A48_09210, partial [Clostridia bacterium]|nr:hypothetical protein [Clostridia bacterium]
YPLLRKGSETTVHAAGFGLTIGGLRPSNTSMGFRQSGDDGVPPPSFFGACSGNFFIVIYPVSDIISNALSILGKKMHTNECETHPDLHP